MLSGVKLEGVTGRGESKSPDVCEIKVEGENPKTTGDSMQEFDGWPLMVLLLYTDARSAEPEVV